MNIKSVILWSKYTRLLHWSLALAVLFLAFSGWLMGKIIDDALFWAEWHNIVGQLIVFLLLARIALFFQVGNSHFSRYKIALKDFKTIKDTLKFYLSLAKTPLPSWFAINPIWRALYALFYLLLIIMALSGLLSGDRLVLGFYWPSIHQSFALVVNAWLVFHLLASFLHDWKSHVNRISAMINGVIYFEVDSETSDAIHTVQPHENIIKTSFDLNPK